MNIVQLQAYNTTVKIAGQSVIVKRHDKNLYMGYKRKEPIEKACRLYTSFSELGFSHEVHEYFNIDTSKLKKPEKKEAEERIRFEKSNARAKEKIHDLVACNCDKEGRKDYAGKEQLIKFLTLTFKENITDLKQANAEFTEFMKRLSYKHFKTRQNVIKYLVVPELQERGAWHFHVVLFNCPYTDNKVWKIPKWIERRGEYVKQRTFENIWGKGYVYINALKRKNGQNIDTPYIAGYITKYMSKELELNDEERTMQATQEDKVKKIYDFDRHKELGLKYCKRYSASRGLKQPTKAYMDLTQEQAGIMLRYLKNKMLKNKREFKKINKYEYKRADGQKILGFMFVNAFSLIADGIESVRKNIMNLCKSTFRKQRQKIAFIKPWEEYDTPLMDRLIESYYSQYFEMEETEVTYV